MTHSTAISNAQTRASKFNRPFAVYIDPFDYEPERAFYVAAYPNPSEYAVEPVDVIYAGRMYATPYVVETLFYVDSLSAEALLDDAECDARSRWGRM